MDTVTESRLAIAMAQHGARRDSQNLSIDEQASRSIASSGRKAA
jgi:IMP dehydrogenase/GMP reductase